jgi:hypothetical protein
MSPPDFQETTVFLSLRDYVEEAAETAGIVWLTGPPGIGKTWAISQIASQAAQRGLTVKLTTAKGWHSLSPLQFCAAVLTCHCPRDTSQAAYRLEATLFNMPRPAVWIIDEAHELGAPVMKMLRGILDNWDRERWSAQIERRIPNAPGFVLVGNDIFHDRSGGAKADERRRWVDRADEVWLDPPVGADFEAVAGSYSYADAEAPALLADFGAAHESFRVVQRVYGRAAALAPAGQLPGAAEIRKSIETHRRMT